MSALCYVGCLIALVAMETRLVYPGAYMDATARFASPANSTSSSEPAFLPFEYPTENGVMLTGQMYCPADAPNIVLFFHGNGSQAAWLEPWTRQLSRALNAKVVLAEYRGFGNDEGTPSEASVIADCLAAHDAVKEYFGVTDSEIILYGRSLGGGCAAAVADQRGAQMLVLERSFERLVDVAAGKYPIFPIRLLMRNRYDCIARLKDYDGAVLQIHGTTDRLIPIEHAEHLFAELGTQDKEFITVPGLGHNDPMPDETMRAIADHLGTRLMVQ
ncbi:alpha/beta hydrolase [Stieleria varia]|uniref:alpha/beta hydrolase n=1 Tax=Stieleria varia TaxID=2528005 RepID=UPI0018D22FB1|nr:alpha/beta hydrolase [Stieleria varia]